MGEQWSSRIAAVLHGPGARTILAAVLEAVGAELVTSEVRSVHRRGTSQIAVVHRVELIDGQGVARDRLYVTHASQREVPRGAATVDADGTTVHVWQFPDDPYLPGLSSAVNVASAAALLRRHGHQTTRPGIRTRSYRPTRRAVVELRPAEDLPPALYVKLLGGRRPARIRTRTERLVDLHADLVHHGLPVPAVLDHDADAGRVVLAAVPGSTLRDLLRGGATPPRPDDLADLLARLHVVPEPAGAGDPDAFADVTRHIALLRQRRPGRAAELDRLAATCSEVGGPVGTIHGDLHDGQLLLVDGEISGLLDVDGCGTGHVAHDVGRLLAGVEASAAATPSADTQAFGRDLREALGYLAPHDAVAAATAAAWVGLATGPLRVASPNWRDEVDERLDRALDWARGAW